MLAGQLADPPADPARPGEGDHGDIGIGADRLARLGSARQNLEHALGQAGFLEDAGDDEAAGQRGARIGLQHDRVAGRQRRRHRAAGQDQREIKGRDDADDAAWQAPRDAETAGIGGQHEALRLGAHRGRAIQQLRNEMDFEAGLGRNAAGFARDPGDQLLLVLLEQGRRLAQDFRALLIRGRGPSGLGLAGLGRGLADILGLGVADPGEHGTGRRLQHIERSADRRPPFGAEQLAAPGLLDHEFRYRRIHPDFSPCPTIRFIELRDLFFCAIDRRPLIDCIQCERRETRRYCCGPNHFGPRSARSADRERTSVRPPRIRHSRGAIL